MELAPSSRQACRSSITTTTSSIARRVAASTAASWPKASVSPAVLHSLNEARSIDTNPTGEV